MAGKQKKMLRIVSGHSTVQFFCVIPSEKRHTGEAAMVNGGYYVLDRRIFDYLEDREDQDFEYGPLEEIAQQGELMMYRHEDFWHCMDNVRDMNALAKMWDSGEPPWKIW